MSSEDRYISREKARRLRAQHPRRWIYIVLIVAVAGMVSAGLAYGFMLRNTQIGNSTSSSSMTYSTSSGFLGTTVALVCNPSPEIVGLNASCTATVSNLHSSPIGPSGAVGFSSSSSGKFQAAACARSGFSLICTTSYASALGSEGTHLLTATYSGDHSHSSSSGTFPLQATKRPLSMLLSCSPIEVPVNSQELCTAQISDSAGGTPAFPTGSVGFVPNESGNFAPTGCALHQGSCSVSFTTSPGKEGVISIAAAYSGDQDHLSANGSKQDAFAAIRRSSGSVIACVPPQVTGGEQTTCTATVSDITGSGTAIPPGGTFEFFSTAKGSTFSPVTCTLSRTSNFSSNCYTLFTPASGNLVDQQISGKYNGDTDHLGSISPTFTLKLKARASTTLLSCMTASTQVGEPVSCTATVSDSSPGTKVNPVGRVTFNSNSSASFSPSSCNLTTIKCSFIFNPESGGEGKALVTASYSGDSNHTSSSGIFVISVLQRPSSIVINCSPDSVPVGASTFCSASVSDQGTTSGPYVPTGTVDFYANGGSFSPAAYCSLSAGGCQVNFTPDLGNEGTIQIAANYNGDVDHSHSAATPVNLVATQRAVTVSVSCSPSSTLGGTEVTCTATVVDSDAGASTIPTGIVSFDDGGFGGNFSPHSCSLVSGSCSVTYAPPSVLVPSTVTITASYSGDSDHVSGSDSTTIQVS